MRLALARGGATSVAGGARIPVRRVRARLRWLSSEGRDPAVITIVRSDRTIRCVCVRFSVSVERRTHCFSGTLWLYERRRAVNASTFPATDGDMYQSIR